MEALDLINQWCKDTIPQWDISIGWKLRLDRRKSRPSHIDVFKIHNSRNIAIITHDENQIIIHPKLLTLQPMHKIEINIADPELFPEMEKALRHIFRAYRWA